MKKPSTAMQPKNNPGVMPSRQVERCCVLYRIGVSPVLVAAIVLWTFAASCPAQPAAGNSQSALANPYLFQGARYDAETGFYYFRNRYYAPEAGRFLQRDPVWDEQNVGGWFTFGGNGPVSRMDWLGLDGDTEQSGCRAKMGEYQKEIDRSKAKIELLERQKADLRKKVRSLDKEWELTLKRGTELWKKYEKSVKKGWLGYRYQDKEARERLAQYQDAAAKRERLLHESRQRQAELKKLELDLRVEETHIEHMKEQIANEQKKLYQALHPDFQCDAPEATHPYEDYDSWHDTTDPTFDPKAGLVIEWPEESGKEKEKEPVPPKNRKLLPPPVEEHIN